MLMNQRQAIQPTYPIGKGAHSSSCLVLSPPGGPPTRKSSGQPTVPGLPNDSSGV
ncbi:uncharacterized protein THITE_2109679 [Thermothielavioides terrestris NRRL 8126]|uniref:Uncharacterized protein n=1 Tax=Thermothielavioides terrestris (strain ATCC 38088 / NRRL 8126) TaxID=578455 RepID=G2QXI5_THETT|nr:uncharacterized protein THITE_2109679 [Thermothielavioides terrestris NRRL 8126]AEO64010.1 hypothetical protein THITE_2109679 [Thermothielavioides terrestris NRRL 8126]